MHAGFLIRGNYLNCRIYITANPARNIHKITSTTANTFRRTEIPLPSPPCNDCVELLFRATTAVFVGVALSVGTGKINVNAGKGTRVVVGVIVGDALGVSVNAGVLEPPGVDWVTVPVPAVPVTCSNTSALTDRTVVKINIHDTNMYTKPLALLLLPTFFMPIDLVCTG